MPDNRSFILFSFQLVSIIKSFDLFTARTEACGWCSALVSFIFIHFSFVRFFNSLWSRAGHNQTYGRQPTDHSSVVAFSVLDNSSKFSILHGQSVICRAGKLFLVLELAITCMHAHEHSLHFNLCPASPYFMSDTSCVPCLCICASTYLTFSVYSAYSHNSVWTSSSCGTCWWLFVNQSTFWTHLLTSQSQIRRIHLCPYLQLMLYSWDKSASFFPLSLLSHTQPGRSGLSQTFKI